jgi:hypothetical protein
LPVVYVTPPFAVAKFGPTESTPLPSARYHAMAPLGIAAHEVGVTVVVLLPVLLAVLESGWSPVTLAESVSEPGMVGVTTIVAVNVFDAAMEGQVQVTVLVPVQLPPLPVTEEETHVEFVGNVITSDGFVPCDVLALKIEMKNVTLPAPKVIGSGDPLTPLMVRSM